MIKCLNRCDATYTYYTPLLFLQLLCNHVAAVISFYNVALRVDRNNHHKNGIEFRFLMIQISEKYTSKNKLCSADGLFFFDFKVIGDYRSVALTIKFDTMTRSILIH